MAPCVGGTPKKSASFFAFFRFTVKRRIKNGVTKIIASLIDVDAKLSQGRAIVEI